MKSNLHNIIWPVLIILLLGCENSRMPAPVFTAQVYYKTQNGDDLLNPLTPGHFNRNEITVTNLWIRNDGTQTLRTAPLSYNGCDSLICHSDAGYCIRFSLENGFLSENTINYYGTVIHLNSSQVDTLAYSIVPMNAGYGVNKVSHKGQTIWSPSSTWTANLTMTIEK